MNISFHTLTPIHIGTGRELIPEFDFVSIGQSVVVLDEQKVLSVICGGSAVNTDDINRWVNLIERGEKLLPYLRQRRPTLVASDIGREIPVAEDLSGFEKVKTIRAQMHGCGLLPGSSLKGAIRTALLAQFIENDHGKAVKNAFNLYDRRNRFNASNLEKKFFGPSPHQDLLRLLQVGDAHFDKTEILKTEVLNLKGNDWRRDGRLETWVEAIPAGQKAECRLKLDRTPGRQRLFDKTAVAMLEPEQLFNILNQHTKRNILAELKFWQESEDNPDELGDYCESLEKIMSEIDGCGMGACVVRVGWASGWRSMTGGWQRHLTDEMYDKLVLSLRPRHPADLPYPKTTRFQATGEPMGFLKLTMK